MIHSHRPAWLKQVPTKIDLVFFDLETTGGNPYNSSIIEIGAIKFSDGQEVGRFETLVKPRHPISPIVQKITGIKNDMVKNAPNLEEIFEDFLLFVGDAVLVSHGASADVAFFAHHKEKLLHKPFNNYFLCTHLLVANFLPTLESKTLTGVAAYFNFQNKYAHTALDDAITTEHIFWKIYELCAKQGYETVEDLIKIQGDQESMQKLGLGFDPSLLNSAPSMSGLLYILSSEQEISYLSASPNMKKSLSKVLELAQDNKEFQKILVDASGFKIERTSNFLDALIREKRELKRLSLPLDPRSVQKRSENFLQIFIPKDLLRYANKNPHKVDFSIPEHHEYVSEDKNDKVFSEEHIEIKHTSKRSSAPIKHTKKTSAFIKTQKYKLNRRTSLRNLSTGSSHIHYGYLLEGIGYAFGPYTNADEVTPFITNLLKKYPFGNSSLPLPTRCDNLNAVVREMNEFQNKKGHLKSGLCVISNNAFKEFEIFVVVKSQIVKKTNLRFEDGEKLKSSRYFTRLFESNYEEIQNPNRPILFTEESCSDIELFSYWLGDKHGEGEWINFADLEALFDARILNKSI